MNDAPGSHHRSARVRNWTATTAKGSPKRPAPSASPCLRCTSPSTPTPQTITRPIVSRGRLSLQGFRDSSSSRAAIRASISSTIRVARATSNLVTFSPDRNH